METAFCTTQGFDFGGGFELPSETDVDSVLRLGRWVLLFIKPDGWRGTSDLRSKASEYHWRVGEVSPQGYASPMTTTLLERGT